MEKLERYKMETSVKIKRSELLQEMENGHITREQANAYLMQYIDEVRHPNKIPDKTVLLFIVDVLAAVPKKESEDTIYTFFHSGYCYYFAVMLKEAFQRGQVCWCAPYGHMCWLDDNGIAYDIGGICDSECEFYIPVSYINEGLSDFLHIPGKTFNASKEYISQAIEKYKTDLLKSVHVTKI